jgi:hypothetical protein
MFCAEGALLAGVARPQKARHKTSFYSMLGGVGQTAILAELRLAASKIVAERVRDPSPHTPVPTQSVPTRALLIHAQNVRSSIRYWMASAMCLGSMAGAASRSEMVRATLSGRGRGRGRSCRAGSWRARAGAHSRRKVRTKCGCGPAPFAHCRRSVREVEIVATGFPGARITRSRILPELSGSWAALISL